MNQDVSDAVLTAMVSAEPRVTAGHVWVTTASLTIMVCWCWRASAGLERRRLADVHEPCETRLAAAPAWAEETVEARLAEVSWCKQPYAPATRVLSQSC